MIRVGIGRNVAHPDIPIGGTLNPPAGEYPVGIAVNQKGQHHPGVVLRIPRTTFVDLEAFHAHPLDRLQHKMRQVVLRNPVAQVGRQKKSLVTIRSHKIAHHHHPWLMKKSSAMVSSLASKSDRLLASSFIAKFQERTIIDPETLEEISDVQPHIITEFCVAIEAKPGQQIPPFARISRGVKQPVLGCMGGGYRRSFVQ